ncbi:VOC family protein [Streptomyces sp. NPDC016845]|uniref:VOC family protein n=1 Tax=Streptomyces sp. NPDC016845 TaxID=3364972 RepID=UPI00378F46BF
MVVTGAGPETHRSRAGQSPLTQVSGRATSPPRPVLPESIVDPAGNGPRVWFQQVPEPKAAKNRWHFDLKVGGGRDVPLNVRTQRVKDAVERLGEAGATVLRVNDDPDAGFYATAMQDPEGNEFDVV